MGAKKSTKTHAEDKVVEMQERGAERVATTVFFDGPMLKKKKTSTLFRKKKKKPRQSDLSAIASDIMASSPAFQERLSRVGDAAARVAELEARAREVERELALLTAAETPESRLRLRNIAAADALVRQREAELEEATAAAALGAAERAAALAAAGAAAARRAAAAEADRSQSAKVAGVAGAAAAVASVPFTLASSATPLSALLSVVSFGAGGLLFGIVYRYATAAVAASSAASSTTNSGDGGEDGSASTSSSSSPSSSSSSSSPSSLAPLADPAQLRAGVVAAFGLARGIGAGDALQALAAAEGKFPLSLEVVGRGALAAGEGVLIAAFAATAVEAAVRAGFVAPLGGGVSEEK